jgi:hypothetical protein
MSLLHFAATFFSEKKRVMRKYALFCNAKDINVFLSYIPVKSEEISKINPLNVF